ncbi:MAG: membrane protein insertase YidC [Chlamydiales bacterium]
MNKQVLLFVFIVSLSFLGLNTFFSHQRDQKNRELMKQQTNEMTLLQSEVAKKTVNPSDLPMVGIQISESEQETVAHGFDIDGTTFTLAWDESLPEKIYVSGKEQWLMSKDPVKGGPVVYAEKPFRDLPVAAPSESNAYELQLVTFPLDSSPQVFFGQFKEGRLSLPLGPIKNNAIAFYKTAAGWLPVGFYESQANAFVQLHNLPSLSNLIQPISQSGEEEKFYVLENDYQQLVFSSMGGALVEINLPFKNGSNSNSVVKEIGFDREIAKNYSSYAHFPAQPYYTYDSDEVHQPGPTGEYYPLIRRGIQKNISPQNYAFNIVSDYPEMAELTYEVKTFTANQIVFEARQPHRKITKTFTLKEGHKGAPYAFELTVDIKGDSRGLWLTSGVPEVEIMSNNSSPLIQYRLSRKGKPEVEKLSLPKPKEMVAISSVYPDWVVNSNGYLGIIMDPLTEMGAGCRATAILGTEVPSRLSVIDPEHKPYPASKYAGYQILMPLPAREAVSDFRIYAGPFEEKVLKTVDALYSDPATGYNPDYSASRTFHGWFSFITEPFAKLLFIVMKFFHAMTNSWAFSIILLTLFLRALLYPLNAWSIKSMRRMQQLSPQIQAIQQRYKKEPKKAQIEIMSLYREKKVNPFMGCIPIVIQIPFLMAMFNLLKSSFQLRGASFIPGWIDNLTAPDVLFQWKTPIFFIGNEFHLLPILLGVVMFIQQRFSSSAIKDPSKMTDQQRQQRTMGTIMTLFFTIMFYHFPSGLNLYWFSSMVLGILQQWVTGKILDKKQKQPDLIAPQKRKLEAK